MKKLFSIPILSVLASLCFVSCLGLGDGGNREEGQLLAVVGFSSKELVPTIRTQSGEFSAPNLVSADLLPGDCIVAEFTLDWDHQPKGDSLVRATNVRYALIEQSEADAQSNFDEKAELNFPSDDLFPIESLTPYFYTPLYFGKVFFSFRHTAPQKQEMTYTAIVKLNADPSDGTGTLYLIGKKTNQPTGSEINGEVVYAIDLQNVLLTLGEDTTIPQNPVESEPAKQLKLKIKYCTEVDENNVPRFQEYSTVGTYTIYSNDSYY
jgi:hypothetical protein